MDKDAWGPSMWNTIHAVALGYPETGPSTEDKRHYRAFYEGLQHVLPCGSCRNNFKKHLEKLPMDLSDQTALFRWTVDFHNAVNGMVGKGGEWSYDKARDHYLTMRGSAAQPGLMMWLTITGVLLLTLIANIVVYFKNRKN